MVFNENHSSKESIIFRELLFNIHKDSTLRGAAGIKNITISELFSF